jgi:hypothetical protein
MVGKGGRTSTSWKEKWNHGKTTHVRLPTALIDQILEYARALDAGLVPHIPEQEIQKATLLAIDRFVQERLNQFHPNQYTRSGNTNTRRWDELRKFRQHIATAETISIVAPTISQKKMH